VREQRGISNDGGIFSVELFVRCYDMTRRLGTLAIGAVLFKSLLQLCVHMALSDVWFKTMAAAAHTNSPTSGRDHQVNLSSMQPVWLSLQN